MILQSAKSLMPALLVLAVILLAACGRWTDRAAEDQNGQDEISLEDFDPEDAELLAAFRRTGCFGHCPIFRVRFYRGGVATFNGEAFVEPLGMNLGKFDESQLESLIKQAFDIGFFDMADNYPIDRDYYIPDMSNTITTLVFNSIEKTVDHNNTGPAELEEIEQKLQELVDKIDWKPDEKRGVTR